MQTRMSQKQLCFQKFLHQYMWSRQFLTKTNAVTQNQPTLENIDFSEQDIFEICKLLNVNKSKGPDDLPPFLFKNAETLSHSIYQIFRKISQTCIFPACWKKAIISPLHKKDDKSDIEIYRPVSLLSVISKILGQKFSSDYMNILKRFSTRHSTDFGKTDRPLFSF